MSAPQKLDALDEAHLRTAIALSREHMRQRDGGPFGAVIARGSEVIATGWNQVTSTNDPTAHAEVVAIRRAAHSLGDFRLEGCVLYASCEPCPMCLAAAYWARVQRIVFAAGRHDAAAVGFDDAFLYGELAAAPDERSLPSIQALQAEAVEVLQAWAAMPDRILY
jgi:tRNA(Arg) A34 adenosine deaminase TadA